MCHYTKLQRQERSLSEGNVTIALHCRYSEKCDIFNECRSYRRTLVKESVFPPVYIESLWLMNVCNSSLVASLLLKPTTSPMIQKMQLQCCAVHEKMNIFDVLENNDNYVSLWMKTMPRLILEHNIKVH